MLPVAVWPGGSAVVNQSDLPTDYPVVETPSWDFVPSDIPDILTAKDWTLTLAVDVDLFNRNWTVSTQSGEVAYWSNVPASDTGDEVAVVGDAYTSAQEMFESRGFKNAPQTAAPGAAEALFPFFYARINGSETIDEGGVDYVFSFDFVVSFSSRAYRVIGNEPGKKAFAHNISCSMSLIKTDSGEIVDSWSNEGVTFRGDDYGPLTSGFACSLELTSNHTF